MKEKLSGIENIEPKKLHIRKPVRILDKAEAKARFDIETKKITQKHQNVLNPDKMPAKKVYIVVPEMKAS